MSEQAETIQNEFFDKKLAKLICRTMYYYGLGDCWYEPMQKTKRDKVLYSIWHVISNCFILSIVLSELTAFTTDLTVKEKNDNVQMAIGE